MKARMFFRELWRYFQVILGSALYTLGLYSFLVPANIAAGGISGILTMVHYLWGFPVGIGYFILNIPLIILGFFKVGKSFIFKTAVSTVVVTAFMDYLFPLFMPVFEGEPLLVCLFGGVISGIGLGLVYSVDGSSGGMDIITRIVKQKYPFMRLGKIMFMFDLLVIAVAAVVYRSLEAALYATVAMYVCSEVIDKMLNGLSEGRFIFIITKKRKEVAAAIINKSSRGCTLLKSEGAYEGTENGVVLCAIRNNETYKITDITKEVDDSAFVVVTNASDILGEGFERNV